MPARLALLWHCHQPDYRDPQSGRPAMPWVRTHALRGYRDLLVETAQRAVPWTINLVPSLLDQLQWYADGGGDDALDAVASAPADLLKTDLRWLPSGHPAMTRAHPPYARLRARLDAGEALSDSDVRDLQVWSLLAWFGATAVRDYPGLGRLRAQGSGFSEADKSEMLAIQGEILREIPALLRALGSVRAAAVSASPYYHPILPLLIDARSAQRAMPHLPDDVSFSWPADALLQLQGARRRVEEAVGREVVGLWPSEGSVSPEVIGLAAASGYRWLATDAQVLARSDVSRTSTRPGPLDLGERVLGWFRDTDLSDRIGFRYAQWPPEEAARDLLAEVARRGEGGVLLAALDGENPWESYADAGGAFRAALCAAAADPKTGVRLVSLDDASREPPVGSVSRLHSGSWIGADFAIWAGHPEDRDAWRMLSEVRTAVEGAEPEARALAMRHILAAEGSDWFWWYGEEFETPWAGHFDALFRAHLAAAWHAIGQTPPVALRNPIRRPRIPDRQPPQRLLPIHPSAPDDPVAWRGAGVVRPRQGSMAAATGVRGLSFGWGEDGALWVRLSLGGEGFSIDPMPDERFDLPGVLIARYLHPSVALSVRGPHGSWPDLPLLLTPPARPALAWWEV